LHFYPKFIKMASMSYNAPSQGTLHLVNHLIKTGAIVSQEVASAMQEVDRAYYSKYDPYADKPQTIGYSATISAPHMHAYALVKIIIDLF